MIYAIEGSDGVGKATQAKLLVQYLNSTGRNAIYIDFPRYDSSMGHIISDMLHGKYGMDPKSLNPYTTAMMFSLDRAIAFQSELSTIDLNNTNLVLDRYTYSNAIHQGCKLIDNYNLDKFKEFCEWVEDIEFNKFHLPKPDKILYIVAPPKVQLQLIEKRGKDIDINETADYLDRTSIAGSALRNYKGWPMVHIIDKDDNLRPIDEVQKDIRKAFDIE